MLPDTLYGYLDAARVRLELRSDMALAARLRVTRATVSQFRRGAALPSDELMVELAEAAGIDPTGALVQLNYWRQRFGRAKEHYRELLGRFGAVVVFLLGAILGASPRPAAASLAFSPDPRSLYIMANRSRHRRRLAV